MDTGQWNGKESDLYPSGRGAPELLDTSSHLSSSGRKQRAQGPITVVLTCDLLQKPWRVCDSPDFSVPLKFPIQQAWGEG